MSDKQSNLTDKEIEDLQSIVTDTLAIVCAMADKHNIDRDSMLKYFADMLTAFTELASIQNYETNHTNADMIRNMSDEELAGFITDDLNFACEHYCDSFALGCAFNCKKKYKEVVLKYLQSEAE
jgi:hypothetical protein